MSIRRRIPLVDVDAVDDAGQLAADAAQDAVEAPPALPRLHLPAVALRHRHHARRGLDAGLENVGVEAADGIV